MKYPLNNTGNKENWIGNNRNKKIHKSSPFEAQAITTKIDFHVVTKEEAAVTFEGSTQTVPIEED